MVICEWNDNRMFCEKGGRERERWRERSWEEEEEETRGRGKMKNIMAKSLTFAWQNADANKPSTHTSTWNRSETLVIHTEVSYCLLWRKKQTNRALVRVLSQHVQGPEFCPRTTQRKKKGGERKIKRRNEWQKGQEEKRRESKGRERTEEERLGS